MSRVKKPTKKGNLFYSRLHGLMVSFVFSRAKVAKAPLIKLDTDKKKRVCLEVDS